MNRFKPAANTYVRKNALWWVKNPFFLRYMVRELTALFLSAYALVLLAGLVALSDGEASFDAWRAWVAAPVLVLFHTAAFLLVAYHSVTWFQVMPKTAPKLPFDAKLVTLGGIALSVFASLTILGLLLWVE